MFENSVVIKILSRMGMWFSSQFENSHIINFFLTQNDKKENVENSIFNRLFYGVIGIFRKIFSALRLDKLFEGSIYRISFLWCALAVILAPVIPTMVLLAICVAGVLSLFLDFICNKDRKLKYFAINKYIYLYAFAYIYATITSVTVSGSLLGGMLTVLFILSFIVIVNSVNTKRQLHILMFFMICIGVVVSLYGFYQFMFPDKFSGVWHDKDMFEDISFRVYSTLENPNVLGEYFLLVIPFGCAYIFNTKSIIGKLFFAGCTGIMTICLILTYSRGCYLGLLFGAAVFLVLYDKRFIWLGIIGLILLPFILPDTIINRFMSIGDMSDSSTSYRVYIWLGTIAMLKDYWLCGIGPGIDAFNLVYPAYAFNSISAPHSHNLFLQIICDAGVIGFAIFVAVIYQYYKASFASLKKEKDKKARVYNIAGASAVTAFMVQSMTDYTFYNYRVMFLFWAVLAVGILFTKFSDMKEA